ncbi:MAG TPA: hypothetical protein VHL14_02865, partial [Steroidobacteraceae bacterium]|nr:hypothetical protein [Steroidobacteraceae bacterium]
MFKKTLSAIGVLFAFTTVGHAQTAVNVTVNANTTVRTVDERVFGVNSTMWDPAVSTQQTINLVQDAGIRFIRLPGGSNSDTLHWYSNQNVDTKTNLPSFKWVTGFDSSSKLIRNISPQAQAIVTVNYG